MQIGMVGLGRMGANMVERLRLGGHEVVGYDRDASRGDVASLDELVAALRPPRAVWLMVPAGEPAEDVVTTLASLLARDDVVIDGGNSYYRDSIRRAAVLDERGILFADAGTSGGIWGLKEGFCLMVGGSDVAFARVEPALATLAPDDGYAHVGPVGSGHFVKMVHNAIEYGMLQAYAEGFDLLASSTQYPDLDTARVAELWRHGSVVRSWLLDLAARALRADPKLATVRGVVRDSGEGRWALMQAIEDGVATPATALALFARFTSRNPDAFSMRMIAALRREFGGHAVEDA